MDKTFVAFSLNVAEARIKKLERKGKDFRDSLPEVYRLGYMARPAGLIFDPASLDTIIIGEKGESGNLLLDDFVSALRSIYLYGSYPQITIDPEEGNPESEWHYVKLTKGIENSHFAKVLFESDYLLKKISLDLVKTNIRGFKTQYRLMIERKRKNIVYSRFWFKPSDVEISVSKNAVFINKYPIRILTETLRKNIKDVSAVKFAESFTQRFDEFARQMPVFEDLRNLLRWVAVASSISSMDYIPDFKFWLMDYQTQTFKIPGRVKGLSNMYADLNIILKVYGGVDSGGYLGTLLKDKSAPVLDELVDLVINSRPSKDTLAWEFSFPLD